MPDGIKPYYYDSKYEIAIFWGDCLDIMPQLEPVDFILADPPYLEGDKSESIFPMFSLTKKIVIFPGKYEVFNWINRKVPQYQYAWKCSGTRSRGGRACLHILFEPILAYEYPLRPLGSDLLDYPLVVDPLANGHPWPKPRRLFSKIVLHWSNPNETILDPFMGSGTTLVAAKELGRKCIGIEIEERYCEIAARRLSQDCFQWRKND